jgi:SSS family solute:Na+ symporter
MTSLDWIIIAIYMAGLIGMSVFLGRGQDDPEDYYVGGRDLPWWAVGISTMATQASVISFVSVPAFVALKEGGGMTLLQFELAVPLAMIFVMVVLIPFFRQLELVSVYEYLELRFSRKVRLLLSATFLISRGLATGVGVFATAVVLKAVTGLELWLIIIIVGVATIIYDTIGGMKAVVWSDVIQMIILVGGVGISIYYAIDLVGGIGPLFDSFPTERWRAIDGGFGVAGPGESVGEPMWAYLLGGFFLYSSYYGVDQSQAQRELSAPTLDDTKRSLVFNGLARFPLMCLYLLLGLAVGAAYVHTPELREAMAGQQADQLVPIFVVEILPAGIRAVIIAAMLAAAMSSLDSALNSLSAATLRDFIEGRREVSPQELLKWSKITTVVWGLVVTGMGLLVAQYIGKNSPVVKVINDIGGIFYGPILAAFVAGVLSRKATGRSVVLGVVVGVSINVILYAGGKLAPASMPAIHGWWLNLIGFAAAAGLALFTGGKSAADADKYILSFDSIAERERPWLKTYGVLVGMTVLILSIGLWANSLAK